MIYGNSNPKIGQSVSARYLTELYCSDTPLQSHSLHRQRHIVRQQLGGSVREAWPAQAILADGMSGAAHELKVPPCVILAVASCYENAGGTFDGACRVGKLRVLASPTRGPAARLVGCRKTATAVKALRGSRSARGGRPITGGKAGTRVGVRAWSRQRRSETGRNPPSGDQVVRETQRGLRTTGMPLAAVVWRMSGSTCSFSR